MLLDKFSRFVRLKAKLLFRWVMGVVLNRRWIYLATDETNRTFRCRGAIPRKQDPIKFARQMSRHGLQVRVSRFYRGETVKET